VKAIVIHAYGGPEVLKFEDCLDPATAAGEVVVRGAAASINPIDIIERSGDMKEFRPMKFPNVLGWTSPERSSASGLRSAASRSATKF
jgi:NADPH:quinone reductase-like Zn-dependent oxidoreductase